ncbi:hypothetical protein TsFJ059_005941, partial [Trichoderma semiorbis]
HRPVYAAPGKSNLEKSKDFVGLVQRPHLRFPPYIIFTKQYPIVHAYKKHIN